MVPKIAKAGTSFKAAGKYYLHDKLSETGGSNSSERVAFTHTQNMLTGDPEAALKVMAWTALHQKQIKEDHYSETHPNDPQCLEMNRAGRPTKTTVYHYSLSWHPDETPSKEQMIEAAQETLRVLKLDEHEVLMVAHSDEPQKHIHIIVNKVHPETGRIAPLKYTKERLSEWAESYEREHGKIYCEERVKNNERRRAIKDFAKATGKAPEGTKRPKDHDSESRTENHQWEELKQEIDWWKDQSLNLDKRQEGERDFLKRERDVEIAQAKSVVRQQMRPHWAAYYRQARERRDELDRLLTIPVRNLHGFLKNPTDHVQFEGGWLTPAWKEMTSPDTSWRAQLEKNLASEKKALADRHKLAIRAALKGIEKRHNARRTEFRHRHQLEEREFYKQQEQQQSPELREMYQKRAERSVEEWRKDAQQLKQKVEARREQQTPASQPTQTNKAKGNAAQNANTRQPNPLSSQEREKKARDELAQIFGSSSRAEKAMRKLSNGNQRKENAQSRGKGRIRTRGYDGE